MHCTGSTVSKLLDPRVQLSHVVFGFRFHQDASEDSGAFFIGRHTLMPASECASKNPWSVLM